MSTNRSENGPPLIQYWLSELHPRSVSYIPGAIRVLLKCCLYMLVESQVSLPSKRSLLQHAWQLFRFRSWPWPLLCHSRIVHIFFNFILRS